MDYLTTEEMNEVATVFRESLAHSLSNYPPESTAPIVNFVYSMALQQKPYMVITQEGLSHIRDAVFVSEFNRDFVLTMSFLFFTRWGHSDEQFNALASNLARGVSIMQGNDNDFTNSVIPKEIADRLVTAIDAKEIIRANKWFMVILLMQLYVTLDDTKKR